MFYLHVRDPQFDDPPYPGERRLGPYTTSREARDQAASDLAIGHLREEDFAGIFDEDGSAARAEELVGEPIARDDVIAEGRALRQAEIAAQRQRIAELQTLLPPDVDAAELGVR